MTMANAKVLVVDDVPENRDLLVRRLKRLGITAIDQAEHGVEALAAIGSKSYDLVLLDIMMPELGGDQVKANPATQAIPVIALTAHAMVQDKERALAAGCDDFDTKPVDLPRLLEKIKTLLNGGKAAAQVAFTAQSIFRKSGIRFSVRKCDKRK